MADGSTPLAERGIERRRIQRCRSTGDDARRMRHISDRGFRVLLVSRAEGVEASAVSHCGGGTHVVRCAGRGPDAVAEAVSALADAVAAAHDTQFGRPLNLPSSPWERRCAGTAGA